jgi:hypothetical protein
VSLIVHHPEPVTWSNLLVCQGSSRTKRLWHEVGECFRDLTASAVTTNVGRVLSYRSGGMTVCLGVGIREQAGWCIAPPGSGYA